MSMETGRNSRVANITWPPIFKTIRWRLKTVQQKSKLMNTTNQRIMTEKQWWNCKRFKVSITTHKTTGIQLLFTFQRASTFEDLKIEGGRVVKQRQPKSLISTISLGYQLFASLPSPYYQFLTQMPTDSPYGPRPPLQEWSHSWCWRSCEFPQESSLLSCPQLSGMSNPAGSWYSGSLQPEQGTVKMYKTKIRNR